MHMSSGHLHICPEVNLIAWTARLTLTCMLVRAFSMPDSGPVAHFSWHTCTVSHHPSNDHILEILGGRGSKKFIQPVIHNLREISCIFRLAATKSSSVIARPLWSCRVSVHTLCTRTLWSFRSDYHSSVETFPGEGICMSGHLNICSH